MSKKNFCEGEGRRGERGRLCFQGHIFVCFERLAQQGLHVKDPAHNENTFMIIRFLIL